MRETGTGTSQYVGPNGSRHFTIPVGLQAGHPLPQGAENTSNLQGSEPVDPCFLVQQPVIHKRPDSL